MYLTEAKNFIINEYPEIEKDFVGCTNEEIDFLEKKLKQQIPEAFKEFLLWFGKKGGPILKGTDYYFKYLSDNVSAP